eukprot:s828_g21.t3
MPRVDASVFHSLEQVFQQSIMVFHIPGHVLQNAAELEGLMSDIALCALLGVRPVLVPSLAQRVLARLGHEVSTSSQELEALCGIAAASLDDVTRFMKQEAGMLCAEEGSEHTDKPQGTANGDSVPCSWMADEPTAADAIELAVPGDAATLSDAVQLGRQRCKEAGASPASLLVELAAEHREPQEAWPLEILASTDAALCLRHVACGALTIDGAGCVLEDSEAQSIEIGTRGADAVRRCRVQGGRVALAAQGPVRLERLEVVDSVIGVSINGNFAVEVHRCCFTRCSAAAIVSHVDLPADKEAEIRPVLKMSDNLLEHCSRDLEVRVQLPCAESLIFDRLPLAAGSYEVPRPSKLSWEVQVSDLGVVSWRCAPVAAPGPRRRKRKEKEMDVAEAAESDDTTRRKFTDDEAWACKILGLRKNAAASPREVRAAYRKKAREVHPDKQTEPMFGPSFLDVQDVCLRVAAKPTGNFITRKSTSVFASSQLLSTAPRKATGWESSPLLGRVIEIDTAQIHRRLQEDDIVCILPVGAGSLLGTGSQLRYVPSEELAAQVAKELKATKLIFFTRGQRLLDTARGNVIPTMQLGEADRLLEYAKTSSSFVEKEESREVIFYLELLLQALRSGTRRAHLIDPRRGALLQELYTTDGSGTMISLDLYDGIRLARSGDVSGIFELIEPLVRRGLLRRRNTYEVERACNNQEMFVWKRDDKFVGCASLQQFSDAPGKAELGCFVISPLCRGKGHGAVLLSYIEQVARLLGVQQLFLLTTQTMQWFVERGFQNAPVEELPPGKREGYDLGRSSKVFIKNISDLPSELQQRFTFVEVDTLD